MAYTRSWDPPNVLLGGADADTIDDAVREFANDLDERFADIVVDVNADPWVLKSDAERTRRVPHWALRWINNSTIGHFTQLADYITANGVGAAGSLYLPLDLRVGAFITGVKGRVFVQDATALISMKLQKLTDAGVLTTVATVNNAASYAVYQTITLGVLNTQVDADASYYVEFVLDNGTGAQNTKIRSVEYSAKGG